MSTTNWTPSQLIAERLRNNIHENDYAEESEESKDSFKPFALLILNQPILEKRRDHAMFHSLWENASLKICADGGANRLYESLKGTGKENRYIPEYICGDLDSLRSEVADYYQSLGVKLQKEPDQDSTDFMKCINLVRLEEKRLFSTLKLDIVGIGGIGGRFDQTMSSIHYMHQLKDERRVYLLSDENMTMLLDKGEHRIKCDLNLEGPTCGILPIGISSATVTTTGLKWNLSNSSTSFGNMVSTSNHLDDNVITIKTDAPIVWTVEWNF